MHILIDIDKELKVPSGIYFRADETEYKLVDFRKEIQRYQASGFAIGVHTVCYLDDDYLGAFKHETELFSKTLGFAPASFTVHGLGQHRMDWRMRFTNHIRTHLQDFGYKMSDCSEELRYYDHVIHDCHWDAERASRYMLNDFMYSDDLFLKAKNYVVLTHPCYWE
jgi:hypothetical protein